MRSRRQNWIDPIAYAWKLTHPKVPFPTVLAESFQLRGPPQWSSWL